MPSGEQIRSCRPEEPTDTNVARIVIDPDDIRRALAFCTATDAIDNPLFSPHSSAAAWGSLTKEQTISAVLAALIAFRALNPLTGCLEENPHILPPVEVVTGILLARDSTEKERNIALLCVLNYPVTNEHRGALGSAIIEATRDSLLPIELAQKAAARLAIKLPALQSAPQLR